MDRINQLRRSCPKRQCRGARGLQAEAAFQPLWTGFCAVLFLWLAAAAPLAAQQAMARPPEKPSAHVLRRPPRVVEAERFLAQRGWKPGHRIARPQRAGPQSASIPQAQSSASAATTWTPLGPAAVATAPYGLVGGRISALALDPADATGNHLYVGTTGGGVWVAQNAGVSTPSTVAFIPLTDSLSALGGAWDASISIGALTVQPGGTGVILAGTGDPNDALDSYYGAGILRSIDGGSTWALIPRTVDLESGLSTQDYSFSGEGFAGFAWSSLNPQVVVAAVSQAYEGLLVDAQGSAASMEGLYYSTDSGATWHLATISDGNGQDVQGPLDRFPSPDGNAATAVVWNQDRGLFIAAVRYHGYYQSVDGAIWTRMAAQPGAGLKASNCPTNPSTTGSIACPIFRGALAVNPVSGDTFAWTVDENDQDQGLWRDACSLSNGACANTAITFAQQWDTSALETNTSEGPATIADGVYNLTLAAAPSGPGGSSPQQGTLVLAGANDLWETACPVSLGCTWRNTTNASTCMSAQVGPFQHALAWNASNSLEIFAGNDSGLWRSMDGIAESGPACDPSDASHFQNLNGQFQDRDGTPQSLAEATSVSPVITTPYRMMAGLGVNGFAGVKSGVATANWPQILGGYGGPVAIQPSNENNWYVNDQAGVAIYLCAQASACTPADFGASPAVTNADVGGDGNAMPAPAPFLVDPLDGTQLLIGTCRVWRGPGSGGGWSASNAVSPILDRLSAPGPCQGDALIRSMAALAVSPSTEIVYLGMYGSANGGASLPGHVLAATIDTSAGGVPAWSDLTSSPVANDSLGLNAQGLDISSVVVDPHVPSGKTVYVTVEGAEEPMEAVQTVYRSTDGGATWNAITANLPNAPVSALAVDPQNANIVYVATDEGVYYTTEVSACTNAQSNCWSPFGTGLPEAPVVALSAAPASAAATVLVAATYGRGIWQTALWSSGTALSAASANPAWLTFPGQVYGTPSAAQTVTLVNTGSTAFALTSPIAMSGASGDFQASGCTGQSVPPGGSCALQVTFTPQANGPRTAEMTVYANVYGGQLTVDLNGTGLPGGSVSVSPASLSFNATKVGSTSAAQSVTLTNAGTGPVPIASVTVTPPFVFSLNSPACGPGSLAANNACSVQVSFAPTQTGPATGLLTLTDGAGTQIVQLTGTGAAPPADVLTPTALAFPATTSGQISAALPVTITNTGDLPLHVTSIAASANFEQSSDCLGGVAAKTDCTISVQFAPTQAGNLAGTLTIIDELGTKTVSLSGAGTQPGALSVSPASLSFSGQQPGAASAPQTVTISNGGGAAVANVGFQITGPAAASYSWGAATCGALLNSGGSCTVQIVFTPSATGPIAATLAVSSSTPGVAAAQVQLNGSGQLASGLAPNPAQLTFSTVIGVGQASAAQTVTIANSSSYTVAPVALAASAPFSLAQNTCTGSLAPGASCTAAVVFQPSASGAATGAITVSSASVANPATVALAGTGFDFTVAPSGPASVTVSSGQQADYKLVLTPNGAQGAFSFQCGTVPSNAVCIFSPGTETLGSGVQGNVEVQIYTGNSAQSARVEAPAGGRGWPLACALALLPLALWRRRRLLLPALLAAVLSAGISSCTSAIGGTTSGSSGQKSVGSTPPGTYSIPVTVTSTGISHSTTLTMTVD